MKSRFDLEGNATKSILGLLVIVGSVAALTLLLRSAVDDYVVNPLMTLANFVGSLINVVPEGTQAAIFVAGASILTLSAFLPERKPSARRRRRVAIEQQNQARPNSSLGGWRIELSRCQNSAYSAEVLAEHIRSLLDAQSIDDDASRPSSVKELVAGTPTWLGPDPVPSWKARLRSGRSGGLMSPEADLHLSELVSYLAQQEGVSLGQTYRNEEL